MAKGIVAKIWNISVGSGSRTAAAQISSSIEYIENPEKVGVVLDIDNANLLTNQLTYVTNDVKTMDGLYVGGRHIVDFDNATNEMMQVKEFYGKLGGRVATHGIISLDREESDPKNAGKLMLLLNDFMAELFPEHSVIERVYSENYAMRKRLNGEVEDTSEYDVPGYMRTGNTFALTGTDMSNEEQIKAYSPTLQDVYQGLLDEGTHLSTHLAAAMEIFVNGSLNLFNHRTNVDLKNRFIVFDLSGLKDNLRITSMLIMMETVKGRISRALLRLKSIITELQRQHLLL